MKRLSLYLLMLSGLLLLTQACKTPPLLPDEEECPPNRVAFKQEVFPIISTNCAYSGCHDAATAADGVVLDSYANIYKEVRPLFADKSRLYYYIAGPGSEGDRIMPPPPSSPLTAEQTDLVKRWINQGAYETDCPDVGCDSTAFKFAADIQPIINSACVSCHKTGNFYTVKLETYAEIKAVADDGRLFGTANRSPGFEPMPPIQFPKTDDCKLAKIRRWVEAGAPND